MRKSFKASARKGETLEFAATLSAAQIAALSAPQVIRIIRTLNDTEGQAFPDKRGGDLLRRRLRTGIIDNPDLREWYDSRLKAIRAKAADEVSFVWKGPARGLEGRRVLAYENLRREIDMTDFLRVREVLESAIGEMFRNAGLLKNHGEWRNRRMYEDLFLRNDKYRPLYRLFGEVANGTFVERTQKAFDALPEYVRSFAYASGIDMRLAYRLGHIERSYETDTPSYARGTPKTYECSSMGVFNDARLSIDLPEICRTIGSGGIYVNYITHDDRRHELHKTIAHEIGHGISAAMKKISADPLVMRAYQEDLLQLHMKDADHDMASRQVRNAWRKQRSTIGYYLGAANGGDHIDEDIAREEAMVENMAELILEEVDITERDIGDWFPNTRKISARILRSLRMDYECFPCGLEFPWGPMMREKLGFDDIAKKARIATPASGL